MAPSSKSLRNTAKYADGECSFVKNNAAICGFCKYSCTVLIFITFSILHHLQFCVIPESSFPFSQLREHGYSRALLPPPLLFHSQEPAALLLGRQFLSSASNELSISFPVKPCTVFSDHVSLHLSTQS